MMDIYGEKRIKTLMLDNQKSRIQNIHCMKMTDVNNVMISRISLRQISVLSEDDGEELNSNSNTSLVDERKWRLSYLRNQFESYELNNLFKTYIKKVNHGYFSLFLILQGLLSLAHLGCVLFSNLQNLQRVLPDLILYGLIVILSIFGLYIVDKVAEKFGKLHYCTIVAFIVINFVNMFVPYYHGIMYGSRYRPAYSGHIIMACYLFFGIENLTISTCLGLVVSFLHIVTLYVITYSNDSLLWRKIVSDAIFLSFMNGLGIYYRHMNEIVTRRSFLDRRDSIMTTHQLRHEENQVKQLMQSIIPDYVITKVKDKYIRAFFHHGKYLQKNPFESSLLDEHENISILFADIVNYTEITSKLKITDLLETLNDLFVLFDETSTKLNITRIKFLGDCYYCVSGLPPHPAPNPAEACVDLGLAMISIIAGVREKRKLNVNMRIGVHTGKIISGVIGSVKYQFDIWSKDVDIANKMESEGVPGMVHITNKTKDLLQKHYDIEPTDKGETVPQFKCIGLQTFLVKPKTYNIEPTNKGETVPQFKCNGLQKSLVKPNPKVPHTVSAPPSPMPRPSVFKKQKSYPNGILLSQLQRQQSVVDQGDGIPKKLTFIDENRSRSSDDRLYRRQNNYSTSSMDPRRSTSSSKRRTAFMNNNLKRYAERSEQVNKEMEEVIRNISFSKYQQYTKIKDINPLLLFNDMKTELEYLKLPDALFKYYILSTVLLIMCVYLIQNLTLRRWDWTTWPFLATSVPIVLILVPVSWADYIYNKYFNDYSNEEPKNLVMKYLCKASNMMTKSFAVRIMIFLVIYLGFSACVLNEMGDCRNMMEFTITAPSRNFFSLLFGATNLDDVGMIHCVLPWHMTETFSMTVIMSFLYLRIFIWIKLLFGTIILSFYAFCVLSFSKGYYEASETINFNLLPQIAHIMASLFLIITLHLVDRQTDYMNRLDFLLNKKFQAAQEEANVLQKVNQSLLINILPKHVANIYLDVSREQKELYFEEHSNVAVVFASIIPENGVQEILDEKMFLLLMNAYITNFDIITNREEFQSIEKIKVAKWTYMAACGLAPGGTFYGNHTQDACGSLQTLLQFVSEMYKKLHYVNRTNLQRSKLRIGICHGDIAAGVVGSKKPLYDIWGDPVNMASRMDSTGVPNHVQVMESTAKLLQKLGYVCKERGNITVKGKSGPVRTFFVEMDKNLNFLRVQN